ncbi:MAG: hypothetical protein JSV96_17685 [Candidatus Aminicenantes bacterium]|nr:MAG: hypothetical protein JSV96_17685 [Candidatus Aminicenantes bacterium]
MNEIIQVNWLLLLCYFFWFLGAGVIVVYISRAVFLKHCRGHRGKIFNIKADQMWFVASFVLIFIGFLFHAFKIPLNRFIVTKVIMSENVQPLDFHESMNFTRDMVDIDGGNKRIQKGIGSKTQTLALYQNGNVTLPYLRMKKGKYLFKFQAKGTAVENLSLNRMEFSKIKIKCEMINIQNYLDLQWIRYVELSSEYKKYQMMVHISEEETVRLQISFINDVVVKDGDRNVWIRGISLNKT